MKSKTWVTIIRVIAVFLVCALLAGAVVAIYRFTNGFNEDFKTFYLECNGERIFSSENRMQFRRGSKYRFDVNYTFDVGKGEVRDYTVKIVANAEYSFDYIVDDERLSWKGEEEITQAFNLQKEDSFFTLTLPDDFTARGVLQSLYAGKEIELDPAKDEELKEKYLYTLVVSSYNEAVIYTIDFSVYFPAPVEEVVPDKMEVYF